MPKPKGKIDLGFAARLEPKDAIAFFESKGYKISFDWWEMEARAHAHAFTVAHMARLDLLEDTREALQKVFDQGVTERDFVKQLAPKLQAKGWWGTQVFVDAEGKAKSVQLGSPHRLKTIYRTNKVVAYNAGIWKQQKERANSRPYWMYVAVLDSHTRPKHAELNGRVFRHDDPIWQYLYPPNGWGCRCRVRDLSERRLNRLGLKVLSSEGKLFPIEQRLGVDKFTGEEIWRTGMQYRDGNTVFTPDPGWSINVGQQAYGHDIELMQKLSRVQDRALRAQVVRQMNDNPARHRAFALWAEAVLDKKRAGHAAHAVGIIDEEIADFVQEQTGAAPARILVIGEKQLVHADSPKHHEKGVALTRGEYLNLPKMIRKPESVLWDKVNQNLLYVFSVEGNQAIKVVVESPMKHKARKQLKAEPDTLDVVINAYRVPTERLLTDERYIRMRR